MTSSGFFSASTYHHNFLFCFIISSPLLPSFHLHQVCKTVEHHQSPAGRHHGSWFLAHDKCQRSVCWDEFILNLPGGIIGPPVPDERPQSRKQSGATRVLKYGTANMTCRPQITLKEIQLITHRRNDQKTPLLTPDCLKPFSYPRCQMSQFTLHDLNPTWLQEAEFGGFTLTTFYYFSYFCITDLVARKVKFWERRGGSCDVWWRKLGALVIDTKINLTWLTQSMVSFLSPQFPVLPELPLSNCTQSGLPVSSPSWARAAGSLTYRWCLSLMRLVLSVETTDLLSSMRTDQRPRLLSFINIQPEAKWMILLKMNSESSWSEILFPKATLFQITHWYW